MYFMKLSNVFGKMLNKVNSCVVANRDFIDSASTNRLPSYNTEDKCWFETRPVALKPE